MIQVLHANDKQGLVNSVEVDTSYSNLISLNVSAQAVAGFSLVANVATTSLDEAKKQTTHVTSNWWDNGNVESAEEIGLFINARSTQAGDVLLTEKGAFEVLENGFKALSDFPIHFLELNINQNVREILAV